MLPVRLATASRRYDRGVSSISHPEPLHKDFLRFAVTRPAAVACDKSIQVKEFISETPVRVHETSMGEHNYDKFHNGYKTRQ